MKIQSKLANGRWMAGAGAFFAAGLLVFAACSSDSAKAKPNFIVKPASKPGVLAKIGDEEITEEMLIGDEKVEFFDLKKREYELRMDRLNDLLVEKLIGSEAKKASLPLDEYIDKNIVGKKGTITDAEFKKFVTEKRIPEEQLKNEKLKERIQDYLKEQKRQDLMMEYVSRLTKSSPVEVYFEKPRMQINVELGEAPVTGSESAPVTIVEFSDFECPFCSRAANTVTELKKKYGNKVRIAFKHFPLPMHRNARPASEASMCVNEQSSDKFWKFHDLAFKNQSSLQPADLEKYAKDAGADLAKFKACMESKKYAALVQADMDAGQKLGVRSTPTFFVNGQLVQGALPIETFSEMIDEEIELAKK